MKKTYQIKLFMISIFTVFCLFSEMLMFIFIKENIIPTYFLLNVCTIALLGSIIFLFQSNKASLIYLSCILGIQCLLNITNCVMYDNCGDIFSMLYFKLIREAIRVFEFSFFNIGKVLIFILIEVGFILLNVYLMKKNIIHKIEKNKSYWQYLKKQLILFSSIIVIFTSTYIFQVAYIKSKDEGGVFSHSYLYSSLNLKVEGLKRFGTWGYYAKETKNVFFSSHTPKEEDVDELTAYLNEGTYDKTEYFGLLEGKNVVMIMMESVQWFAIDEYLTPNLYNLAYNGLTFSNYYSKNKTNISEMISITGSYPVSNTLAVKSTDYDFSISIINQLADSYVKNYVHANTGTFYNRNILMDQLGFDNSYFYYDLFPNQKLYDWGDFTLDSVAVSNSLDYLVPKDATNFYSFFTTLSTHGPYNKSDINIDLLDELGYFDLIDSAIEEEKWENPLEGTRIEDSFRYYKAMAMDLDKAVGILIDELETNNLLEDTVIVLFGDHNAYYDDISYLIYDSMGGDYYKPYIFKTPLIIYNETLTEEYKNNNGITSDYGVNIEKFVSTYNIVPTLLDLLGIEFNSNLYFGTSVFYEDDYNLKNVFFSLQGGIFNDVIYTINGYDLVYTELEDYEDKLKDFRIASELFLNKLKYIENIYSYNLFSEIEEYIYK